MSCDRSTLTLHFLHLLRCTKTRSKSTLTVWEGNAFMCVDTKKPVCLMASQRSPVADLKPDLDLLKKHTDRHKKEKQEDELQKPKRVPGDDSKARPSEAHKRVAER